MVGDCEWSAERKAGVGCAATRTSRPATRDLDSCFPLTGGSFSLVRAAARRKQPVVSLELHQSEQRFRQSRDSTTSVLISQGNLPQVSLAAMITRTSLRSLNTSSSKSCCRCYSQRRASPHPSLVTIPSFLSPEEHKVLLVHSLRLLDSPSRTSAAARKLRRQWVKANPGWDPTSGEFPADEATLWEEGHFDGVIRGYRETLVRAGQWGDEARPGSSLASALDKVYSLLPPPPPSSSSSSSAGAASSSSSTSPPSSPPDHLILHLLHLSSRGSIAPHVDNLEAFGRTIAGVSLGGDRVMRFKQVSEPAEGMTRDGPSEFDVLLEKESAYVQS